MTERIPPDMKDISPKVKENLEAVKHATRQPRGINIDARINTVISNIGESEIFATLREIRWPEGIVCPRCHSTRVIRKLPPPGEPENKWFYECTHCKEKQLPSLFDDLTEFINGKSLYALRQWILCFYLMKFCSLSQIATALGVQLSVITQLLDNFQEQEVKSEEKLKDKAPPVKKKDEYRQKEALAYSEELLKRWRRPGGPDGLNKPGTLNIKLRNK